ncbi:MAG: YkgJ family cysteine cluster protein [Chlamydiales bacterium]
MTSEVYEKGLRFQCTECGKCCTGTPGYVWVSEKEIEEMTAFLGMDLPTFRKKYIRRIGQRYSLVESKITYDCVFLKNKKCQLYKARPIQCRTFPFWPQNVRSEEAWEETARECEGINADAPLVPKEQIESALKIYEESR